MAKPPDLNVPIMSVDTSGAKRKIANLRDAQGRFVASTSTYVDQIAQILTAMIKQRTPVATGALAASTTYTIARTHSTWRIRIRQPLWSKSGIPRSYLAGYGRGPMRRAPLPAYIIQSWMESKGMSYGKLYASKITGMSYSREAYRIARHIDRVGTVQFYTHAEPYWQPIIDYANTLANGLAGKVTAKIKATFNAKTQEV